MEDSVSPGNRASMESGCFHPYATTAGHLKAVWRRSAGQRVRTGYSSPHVEDPASGWWVVRGDPGCTNEVRP